MLNNGDIEEPIQMDNLDEILLNSTNTDSNTRFQAIQAARQFLVNYQNGKIKRFIQSGILFNLIECLDDDLHPDIQFDAAWILTNITSDISEQSNILIKAGAVPLFIKLLASPHSKVREQILWALGNIIGDGPILRDYVLSLGVIPSLLQLINSNVSISCLQHLSWIFKNICRHINSPPTLEFVAQLLPALRYLVQYNDSGILDNVTSSLLFLSGIQGDHVQILIKTDIVRFLVPLLCQHNNVKIKVTTLNILGNIVAGTEEQTQYVLNYDVLSHFPQLFKVPGEIIVKNAMWFLSNVAAGSEHQIQAIIDHGLIPWIIHLLNVGYFQTQKEALWTIFNLTTRGTRQQMSYIVQQGVIASLCKKLTCRDDKVVGLVLKSILKILQAFEDESGVVCKKIAECGGLNLTEEALNPENKITYGLANGIISRDKLRENNFFG